jgi:hypothetical protein
MKYKVELNFSYGWDDAGWEDDDKPTRFDSIEEAQAAIDELITDVDEAVKLGHMTEGYRKDDYRVVPDDQ